MLTPFTLSWDGIRLYGFMLFFVAAGIGHIIKPKPFMAIIPFLPYRKLIVIVTGIMEIVLGIGLLFSQFREILVWLTILYLIAIFPGNIYMAMKPERYPFSKRSLYLRLPLQFVFIIWVYSLRTIS